MNLQCLCLPVVALLSVFSMGCAGRQSAPAQGSVSAASAGDDVAAVQAQAKAGDAVAQFKLGVLYDRGPRGLLQDYEFATSWYRRSADRGYALAQYELATRYVAGKGISPDDAQAVVWLGKAAERGHAQAQYELAVRFLSGQGVVRDDTHALIWLRKASDQGHAGAQYELGAMSLSGRGVPRDDAQALAWFRSAAERGQAQAQYQLGTRYRQGKGVPQDNLEAFKWFDLASRFAYPKLAALAQADRDSITASWTPQQIADAKARTFQWMVAFEGRPK